MHEVARRADGQMGSLLPHAGSESAKTSLLLSDLRKLTKPCCRMVWYAGTLGGREQERGRCYCICRIGALGGTRFDDDDVLVRPRKLQSI